MISKFVVALAVVGLLGSATVASAQVGGGNELPNKAKMKGGQMKKGGMMMKKHHSMKKMHKSM